MTRTLIFLLDRKLLQPGLAILFWFAFALPALAQAGCTPAAEKPAGTLVAEFTGTFDHGTPVYRLPAVKVSAPRTVAVVEAQVPKRDGPARQVRRHAPS
jgi:hypothetical protein